SFELIDSCLAACTTTFLLFYLLLNPLFVAGCKRGCMAVVAARYPVQHRKMRETEMITFIFLYDVTYKVL
ncbi:hypothetical protein, partial [Klebsiella pneumoniae]|uniref:hypothetical protein n=1 Tax=Klebsiella pneumoniae TaxID=573 RepID=UPI003B58BCA1